MAGSQSPDAMTIEDIRHLIEAAGLSPQERNTMYQRVVRG